jgi:NADH:ubiquinone oxidoreductase subunit E
MNSVESDQILAKYPEARREYLIQMLQDFQEVNRYVSKEIIQKIGGHLRLPASKIYGVATFYNQFKFNAPGKYHIQVCRGTACHVKGSSDVLDIIARELKINPGQTTRDGMFSLEIVACLGARGLGPGISGYGGIYAGIARKKNQKFLKQLKKDSREK